MTPTATPRAVLLIALLGLVSLQVTADPEADHERARAARLRGEVRPIAEILRQIGAQVPGEVIGIELERGRRAGQPVWIYELKILTADGRRLEVEVDAQDGRILELEDDD
ncbi:PepSY domain-containing protein [Thermochromatium tepidum]|uniref:Peptidase n=1 Tax=Thermochromatium tepidum ATCC 43061 TaxID=316276 RepID=A0A6I6EEW5_THETI|nr:PepSY domain-containing protein [Thermochromatium tepidum]QGU33776.1 peptidase [Thermochromatium tepidum ATCC 43061]